MAQYYYLASSLPFLQFKEAPALTYGDFLEQCSMWLNSHEMTQVASARIDIESIVLENVSNDLLWSWIVFENSLRNELVRLRAGDVGVSPDAYVRTHIDSDPTIALLAREAMKDPSPLKVEFSLLEARWNFLEDHIVGHYFDLTAVIIYGLKLQLLERKGLFTVDKGQKVFHIIYEGNKDEEERKYRENSRD